MTPLPLLLVGLLASSLTGAGTVYAESAEEFPEVQHTEESETSIDQPSVPPPLSGTTKTSLTVNPYSDNEEGDDEAESEIDEFSGAGGLRNSYPAEPDYRDAQSTENDGTISPHAIIGPVAVVLLIAVVTIGVVLHRKKKNKTKLSVDIKEEEGLAGCEAEKIPTPVFDDDIPSVLELEMEDLEKWAVKTDPGETALASEKED
ncbi:hypothetical protein AGOR_G00234170 [Albula goreensis]|uniref:Transmembrane protein 154 n=1 Tax=Albula goreensis TaxID=1534307 RepID=A0A8T3CJP2_9TELE|nr:hypothetical protein AGOR_G00234170 [Albula goreensis]